MGTKTVKPVQLLLLGAGTVGGAVITQVLANRESWAEHLDLDVRIGAVARTGGVTIAGTSDGLGQAELEQIAARTRLDAQATSLSDALNTLAGWGSVIVVDAAAGEATAEIDAAALAAGHGVVLSNKAPLALPWDDSRAKTLWHDATATGRLRYEATCGAGLPVISTLRALLDTGDAVLEITGALSGTMGAIFSDVTAGKPFSRAVRDAKAHSYTEPDPRDDLSGLDIARKALILARTMGREIDLAEISVESLVPPELADVSVDEFLDRLDRADAEIGQLGRTAAETGASLKFVAHVPADGEITVGLRNVPVSTVLGALQGPENIVSFRTARYDAYPTVISGPGAGAEVTAAGVIGDILSLARAM